MERLGFSLNTMTLGGLAIALGEVVDDGVIDVEGILRRLRENHHAENPRPAILVVLDAPLRLEAPWCMPHLLWFLSSYLVLTMSGVAGRLFAPLGIAYVLSVLASLFVALTVTPAPCLIFLGSDHFEERVPPVARWLQTRYASLPFEGRKGAANSHRLVTVLTACGVAVLPFLSRQLPA